MRVLIPLAPGTKPHPDTLASIDRQSVPCEVVTRSLPYTVRASQRLMRVRQNLCDNRNALMASASDPYSVMMNHDVVLSSVHDISDCICFLSANHEWDVVALNTKADIDIKKQQARGHVVDACIVFRTAAMRNFLWEANEDHCPCVGMNCEQRVCYLDNRQLTEAG